LKRALDQRHLRNEVKHSVEFPDPIKDKRSLCAFCVIDTKRRKRESFPPFSVRTEQCVIGEAGCAMRLNINPSALADIILKRIGGIAASSQRERGRDCRTLAVVTEQAVL
jgi:hypothetical protein